jgi:hypothetical protein
MDAFREAIAVGTTKERKREIERELREYCELDTLAMVRVWEVFGGGQRTSHPYCSHSDRRNLTSKINQSDSKY